MTVKLKDIRAGKTFFHVHAFPDERKSWITETVICSLPYNNRCTDSLFVKTKYKPSAKWLGDEYISISISLTDAGVVKNNYNFHRLFKTRKEAERYVERFRTRCFTAEEQKRVAIHQRKRMENAYWKWGII